MFGGTLVTSCKGIEHCPSDAYCDPSELVCRPCIQCVELKRLSPLTPVACITSITQCGSCFTGLVENKRSLTMECEVPESSDAWDKWLFTIIALHVLALLLCFCAALVLRNFRAYKLRASTNATTTHALRESSAETALAPPPYNPTGCVVPLHHVEHEETSSPLIKEAPSLRPEVAATRARAGIPVSSRSREAARHQGATVFNEPLYQSLIIPSNENNTSLEILQPDSEIPESLRDTPTPHYNRANSPETTLHEVPHSMDKCVAFKKSSAKKQRARQDSVNDSEDSGYNEPHGSSGGAGGGPSITANNSIPFFINIFKNFTTVTQDDDESVF